MNLNELSPKNRTKRKRIGRGTGSGHGFSCGRGIKGQGQRKSGNVRPGFEGGQTPLYKRLPKLRGFKSHNDKAQVVNLGILDKYFAEGEVVSAETLKAKGLINDVSLPVKILGKGKLTKKLKIEIEKMSVSVKKIL